MCPFHKASCAGARFVVARSCCVCFVPGPASLADSGLLPIIPTFKRPKEKEDQFKANLVYSDSVRGKLGVAVHTWDPSPRETRRQPDLHASQAGWEREARVRKPPKASPRARE